VTPICFAKVCVIISSEDIHQPPFPVAVALDRLGIVALNIVDVVSHLDCVSFGSEIHSSPYTNKAIVTFSFVGNASQIA
jgi:hypothetical protein